MEWGNGKSKRELWKSKNNNGKLKKMENRKIMESKKEIMEIQKRKNQFCMKKKGES